jgi:hypothetical protein
MDLEPDSREASYQELVSLGGATPLGPMSPKTKPKISRPPSYSDSFIVLGTASTTATALPSISPYREDISSWTVRSPRTPLIAEKGLSILLHVVLISLFETVFYFQFVSQSEDAALMKTVDGILDGTVRGCQQWPANVTRDINYILDLLVNVSEISAAGSVAAAGRARDNTSLQIQSWIYTSALSAALIVSLSAFKIKGWRINWRVLLGENLALIIGLGLYEFMFFKTIVYNYSALTVPEIDARVVEQLEQSCGLFH